LGETQGLDGLIQTQNKLGLQIMFFSVGKSELQPHIAHCVLCRRNLRHRRFSRSATRSFSRRSMMLTSAFDVLMPAFDFFRKACQTYTASPYRTVYTARYALPSWLSLSSTTVPPRNPLRVFTMRRWLSPI